MSSLSPANAHPWREIELTLTAAQAYANGYTDVEVWADFTHESGLVTAAPGLLGRRQHLEGALSPRHERILDVAHVWLCGRCRAGGPERRARV